MAILPCRHKQNVVDQVPRTINLLTNLDTLHPEVLVKHAIEPTDYQQGMVFRSAIESIRGTFIASSTVGREAFVRNVFETLLQEKQIADYEQSSGSTRYDFTIALEREPDYFVALEVKGGEGNSINISERPLWAKEFAVWSHLDGAIVNQPARGAHSIINRLTNELVRRHKQVDILFFKDALCGTSTRPCPKYSGNEERGSQTICPDVFLFPQRIPTLEDPTPPTHTLETLRLPNLILSLFNRSADNYSQHIWNVQVTLIKRDDGKLVRIVQVSHQDTIVAESRSRPWTPS